MHAPTMTPAAKQVPERVASLVLGLCMGSRTAPNRDHKPHQRCPHATPHAAGQPRPAPPVHLLGPRSPLRAPDRRLQPGFAMLAHRLILVLASEHLEKRHGSTRKDHNQPPAHRTPCSDELPGDVLERLESLNLHTSFWEDADAERVKRRIGSLRLRGYPTQPTHKKTARAFTHPGRRRFFNPGPAPQA